MAKGAPIRGRKGPWRSNVAGDAREEESLRAEVERRIIDFLEIVHIRNTPVANLSYGLQKRGNWPARWRCSRASCCWTNPTRA